MSEAEFYIDVGGDHRWRVTATNGEEIAASSEGFSSRAAAEENFRLIENLEADKTEAPGDA